MRLSCLNLCPVMPLSRILFVVSIVSLPFTIAVGLIMSYTTGGLDPYLLSITIFGSYLNLIAALLIVYAQRHDCFLLAQFINVSPNIILIPGIIICWYYGFNLIFSIVALVTLIPIAQCFCLFLLPIKKPIITQPISYKKSFHTILRHLLSMSGEQLFQIIARSAFYAYGTGFLSVYAILIRIYSALKFILVDSFIGSKLATWQDEKNNQQNLLARMINSTLMTLSIAVFVLAISLKSHDNLLLSTFQMMIILLFGFYFSTLVRIIYFKINTHENNAELVIKFALLEIACALIAFLTIKQFNSALMTILWIGYIAKPLSELIMLRKRYHALQLSEG